MVNVGIDSRKTQFTVCVRGKRGDKFSKYPTTAEGYAAFFGKVKAWRKARHEVKAGVESTGNTRYFKGRLEEAGVKVTVINTLKFKVVSERSSAESVKKTDKHDAATIRTKVRRSFWKRTCCPNRGSAASRARSCGGC